MDDKKKPKAKKATEGQSTEKPKAKMGAPSSYKPEYCEAFKEMCRKGLSVPEIAAHLNVRRQTLWDWAERYPDFADAYKTGSEYRQLWWANLGKLGLMGEKKVNLGFYVWLSKNLAGWQDKVVSTESQDLKDVVNDLPEQKLVEDTEAMLALIKNAEKK